MGGPRLDGRGFGYSRYRRGGAGCGCLGGIAVVVALFVILLVVLMLLGVFSLGQ